MFNSLFNRGLTCLSTLNMPNFKWTLNPFFGQILPKFQVIQIFYLATTQSQHVLCLYVLALVCLSLDNRFKLWILLLILLLSNDIESNLGPATNHRKYFNFMCWNLNSFSKDDFTRKDLIEAHNLAL